MTLSDSDRELLEDKFLLWSRAAREGPVDLRDYNRRAAEALKNALSICAGSSPRTSLVEEILETASKLLEVKSEWTIDRASDGTMKAYHAPGDLQVSIFPLERFLRLMRPENSVPAEMVQEYLEASSEYYREVGGYGGRKPPGHQDPKTERLRRASQALHEFLKRFD